MVASDGHRAVAVAVCLATMSPTARRLSGVPCRVGNSGSLGSPPRSFIQAFATATICLGSGVDRSFLPFPLHRTCGPVPSWMSWLRKPVSSETRRPVCAAKSSSAWSRRPSQVSRSGASTRASSSALLRYETSVCWQRLVGMASTRAMSPACSGWRSAAYLQQGVICSSCA